MEKIRVLQIGCDNIGYGGRSMAIYNLTQPICRHGIEVDYLYFGNKIPEEYCEKIVQNNGNIVDAGNDFCKKNKIIKEIIRFESIKKNIGNSKYDIAHINADNAYEALKSVCIVRILGIKKVLVHAHTTGSKKEFSFLLKLIIKISQQILDKFVDCKIACSKEAELYMYGRHNKSTIILKNGIDLTKFQFCNDIRMKYRKELKLDGKVAIGCVGRLSYPKNHFFLLHVFKEFEQMCSNSILVLVGEGELKEAIKKETVALGLQNKVMFLGNRLDVNNILQAMDVFCLTSFYEGFGIVNIEAQASGLPCLVSDAIPKEVKVNETFQFMSIDKNPKDWANKLQEMLNIERISNLKVLKEKGYDIHESANLLEIIYREIRNDKK